MVQEAAVKLPTEAFTPMFEACSNWGRWGADDERGTLNLLRPEHRLRAARTVRHGISVSCSLPINTKADLENTQPALHVMTRAGDVVGTPAGQGTSMADYLGLAPHGRMTTHLDGLCHFSWEGKIYNDRPVTTVTSLGALHSDITIGEQGILSRGVLLDIPRVLGVEWLEPDAAVTPEQLDEAAVRAGLDIGEADIVLVRTGRWARRKVTGPWDSAKLLAGLDHRCGPWLRERDVLMLGGDGTNDAKPNAFAKMTRPIHVLTLVAMGMQIIDNLDLEDLARTCAELNQWEFLFSVAPLRLARGTTSAINAIAVL